MTAAFAPASAPLELEATARLGQGIQTVVEVARQVNLAALNAMLQARRSGERAIGFRVATAELRDFAGDLMATMEELAGQVADLVRGVAQRQRQQRIQGYFVRAATAGEAAAGRLAANLATQTAQLCEIDRHIASEHGHFRRVARQALRHCDLGLALSRNALVEATYGGTMAPLLKDVALQLREAIQTIIVTLRSLRALDSRTPS